MKRRPRRKWFFKSKVPIRFVSHFSCLPSSSLLRNLWEGTDGQNPTPISTKWKERIIARRGAGVRQFWARSGTVSVWRQRRKWWRLQRASRSSSLRVVMMGGCIINNSGWNTYSRHFWLFLVRVGQPIKVMCPIYNSNRIYVNRLTILWALRCLIFISLTKAKSWRARNLIMEFVMPRNNPPPSLSLTHSLTSHTRSLVRSLFSPGRSLPLDWNIRARPRDACN